jgi:type I restriction-modification system DNA methylase subunit
MAGYGCLVSQEDILNNDCNRSVARYANAIEEVHRVDIAALRTERTQLNAELAAPESEFTNLLNEVNHE